MNREECTLTEKIAVVGTGLVGTAWAIVFARAGREVWLHDVADGAVERSIARIETLLPALAEDGLLNAQSPEAVRSRLHPARSLAAALEGAVHVQESGPERLEVKRELHAEIDALAPPGSVVASSTSGIRASTFSETLDHRERVLVAHPINPPHLVPLVELVPAPWTAESVVDATADLMRAVGQSPVRLNREVNGFVVNRLQGALLAEAFRLVEDGVCGVEDVDAAIADGLGLRWSFIGPFETIDLNSPDGVKGYCDMLGDLYYELACEQADPRRWEAPLVERIEGERRAALPKEALAERQAWRDRWLAQIVKAKGAIREVNGG